MEKRNNKKVIIKVSDLSKSFNNTIVLKNINFQLLEGESLAIIGASGSGKSVLLKNIIGLLQPDKGSIVINDTEIVNLPRNLKDKNILYVLHLDFTFATCDVFIGTLVFLRFVLSCLACPSPTVNAMVQETPVRKRAPNIEMKE